MRKEVPQSRLCPEAKVLDCRLYDNSVLSLQQGMLVQMLSGGKQVI